MHRLRLLLQRLRVGLHQFLFLLRCSRRRIRMRLWLLMCQLRRFWLLLRMPMFACRQYVTEAVCLCVRVSVIRQKVFVRGPLDADCQRKDSFMSQDEDRFT